MYFISVVTKYQVDQNDDWDFTSMCVGYEKYWNVANEKVTNNEKDIDDGGLYPYAVIEKIENGIYPTASEEHWFKFDKYSRKYNKIERPKEFNRHRRNFAIFG